MSKETPLDRMLKDFTPDIELQEWYISRLAMILPDWMQRNNGNVPVSRESVRTMGSFAKREKIISSLRAEKHKGDINHV